ncbi:MAG: hypothetical protein FWG62_03270 [Proteobacteria bacterium]|nr:hypothetical protein [Pseudomonadota bacterium]
MQCIKCITKNIKIIIKYIFIALFLLYVFYIYSCLWVNPYSEFTFTISHDIKEILIKYDINAKHDRDTPFFEISGIPGKYTVNYYQAEEIPFAAKMATIKYFIELYEERGRNEQFRLNMYRETKAERRGIFSGVKPFFELTIGGDK